MPCSYFPSEVKSLETTETAAAAAAVRRRRRRRRQLHKLHISGQYTNERWNEAAAAAAAATESALDQSNRECVRFLDAIEMEKEGRR